MSGSLWDNQHWLKKCVETSPEFGSQGVPRTFCSQLSSYLCSSGTRVTDCTTKVPVSSMTMRSVVFNSNNHKHTSRPPRLQLVSSARQLNSPGLALQAHVGCVTVVRLTLVEELEKIGTMLDQPSQQRTSRLQRDSRLLFQEVFEGPRKSVHMLQA